MVINLFHTLNFYPVLIGNVSLEMPSVDDRQSKLFEGSTVANQWTIPFRAVSLCRQNEYLAIKHNCLFNHFRMKKRSEVTSFLLNVIKFFPNSLKFKSYTK